MIDPTVYQALQVVFRCDADLGELDVEVVAGQAVRVSVAPGAPRAQVAS